MDGARLAVDCGGGGVSVSRCAVRLSVGGWWVAGGECGGGVEIIGAVGRQGCG